MDDALPLGSPAYFGFLLLLVGARGADLLSTWIATPHLELEANPIARWLGWRRGMAVNLLLCAALAVLPLAAIVVATTSVLVASRNFQSAWLMRSMGEARYRCWMVEQVLATPVGLYLGCIAAQVLLHGAVGAGLLYFARWRLVPFGVGLGVVAYAFAVGFFTLLSLWRLRRRAG